MKRLVVSCLCFTLIINAMKSPAIPVPLESPKHNSKERVFKFIAEFLIRREQQEKERADTLAEQSKHDPEIESEVRRSRGRYTAQADTKSIDQVFIDPIFIERSIKGSPIFINSTEEKAVVYANPHMCVVNIPQLALLAHFNIQRRAAITAVGLGAVNANRNDHILFGDTQGGLYGLEMHGGNPFALGTAPGRITGIFTSPFSAWIGLRYMVNGERTDWPYGMLIKPNAPLEEKKDSVPCKEIKIVAEKGIRDIVFKSDYKVETRHYDNSIASWVIENCGLLREVIPLDSLPSARK